jgi:hypothetical protein
MRPSIVWLSFSAIIAQIGKIDVLLCNRNSVAAEKVSPFAPMQPSSRTSSVFVHEGLGCFNHIGIEGYTNLCPL